MNLGVKMRAAVRVSLMTGAATLSLPSASHAQDQVRTFDVPAQAASTGIPEFAREANVQILVSEDDVSGKTTNRVHGDLSVHEALRQLLSGTKILVTSDDGHTIILSRGNKLKNEEAASDNGAAINSGVETVVVTGTNIRGVINATSPIMIIDSNDIARTGYTDTAQLVASLPQNFGGGQFGATADGQLGAGSRANLNVSGATGFNLRGLGADSTLVLLDGNRIAGSARGEAVDVSIIPLAAIDRVEIVSDGASAIYGSDAIGGVVNFKLRKDYDGAETSVRYGTVTDGSLNETTIDQTVGRSWDTGGVLVGLEFENQTALPSSERAFTATAFRPTDILPAFGQFSGIVSAHQDILDNVDVSIDALVTHKITTTAISTATGFPGLPVQGTTSKDNHDSLNFGGTIGYRPFGDWRVELSGSFSQLHDGISYSRFSPLPDVPTLADTGEMDTDGIGLATIKADGTLFSLPGGDVKAAFGATYSSETLRYDSFASGPGDIPREVASGFAEFYVPLIGEANALPFVRKLDLSAAVRYDHYSDFGGTTNPKIGLLWQPVQAVNIRGSYGTSFRAPNPQDLIENNYSLALFNYDFVAPNGVGTVPVFVLQGGDPNLGPEKADTLNVGFDVTPDFLPGAKLSMDYYNIHFVDRIITPPFDVTALTRPGVYGSLITQIPSDAAAAAFLASEQGAGVPYFEILGTGTTGVRYFYNAITQNAASVFQSGFDINAQYQFALGGGDMVAHGNAAIINQISTAFAKGSTASDLVNTYANPLHVRVRADLSWANRNWALTTALNYSGSYEDTSAIPEDAVGAWTTVDLNVQYSLNDRSDFANGVVLDVSVQNLFDTPPPFVQGAGLVGGIHYDVGNANPLGRLITFGIKKAY